MQYFCLFPAQLIIPNIEISPPPFFLKENNSYIKADKQIGDPEVLHSMI